MADSVDRSRNAGRAVPALVLSATLFGAMAVAARSVSTHIPAPQIAAIRFLLGLLGMGVVALLKPSIFVATRPGLLFVRGFFGTLSVLGYFFAIQHVSTGMATLLNYTFPLWGALCAAIVLKERVTPAMAAGMAVSTVGLVVVVDPTILVGEHQGRDALFAWGIFTGLAAGVSGGVATTAVRALRRTESASATFTAFCAVGLLMCGPLALADWHPVPSSLWPALLLVGALGLSAQLLFTWSLGHVPTGRGGMVQQLTVVASYSLAWLFLGEPIALHVVLGAVLVMGGVLWVGVSSPQ